MQLSGPGQNQWAGPLNRSNSKEKAGRILLRRVRLGCPLDFIRELLRTTPFFSFALYSNVSADINGSGVPYCMLGYLSQINDIFSEIRTNALAADTLHKVIDGTVSLETARRFIRSLRD